MAQIRVNNLTFYYDGSFDDIFENVSFFKKCFIVSSVSFGYKSSNSDFRFIPMKKAYRASLAIY